MNPILAFVGAEASARLIYSVTNIENEVYHTAYISWLSPKMASLAFAMTFVLVWLAILTPFYRRRIFLKI